MGIAPSVIIDPVRVPRIKGRYPPPLAPKWFLPDIRTLVNTPEVEDLNSRGINWDALERSIDEDEEDGVDATKDTIRIRPSSGVGSARTDSGLKKVRQAKRHGLKHGLSFEAIDKHAKLALPANAATFEDLLHYSKQSIDEGLYPDTYLVRAISVKTPKRQNTGTQMPLHRWELSSICDKKPSRLQKRTVCYMYAGR